MKLMPSWWNSIRAILSLTLALSYCSGVLIFHIPKSELEGLKELATMAIVFYFAFKKRDANGNGQDPKPQ